MDLATSLRRAGIATLLERAGQVLQWGEASEITHLEPQQRAKLAFDELGPTFVKLGQMLSTREDLLFVDLPEADPFAGSVPLYRSCRKSMTGKASQLK